MGALLSTFSPSMTLNNVLVYRMPSTHSATITFFGAYILLASLYLPIHPSFPGDWRITRVLPPLFCVPCASLIAASRYWLGHHTLPQIGAGVALGLVMTTFWFTAWTVGGVNQYGRVLEEEYIRALPF